METRCGATSLAPWQSEKFLEVKQIPMIDWMEHHNNLPWSNLVGGLDQFFFHILGMSSSQRTFICFRGVGIPPTSN